MAIDCQSIRHVYDAAVAKPTIQDVARAAGVHPGTVSRALNPLLAGRVTAETTRRVEEAAARLGYVPDQLGRSLRTRRSFTVGVLVPDLGNPVFPPIVRGIEDTLRRAGYEALIANTDDGPEHEARLIEVLKARRCDGFVIASSRRDAPAIADLVAAGDPVVLVNRLVESGADSVASDDVAGMTSAVDHLVGLGHTEIAYVSGPLELSMTHVRRAAFADAVRAAGLPVNGELVETAERYAVEEGQRAFTRLLERRRPTAVIAGNDLIAVGCYAALRNRELRCPADVSVVGFNDMPLSGFLNPPLTTVAIPQYEIGVAAAELVLSRISGAAEPQARLLPTELVTRESTAPPGGVRPSRPS
jgi:LacI family transcriptional regulator